MMHRSRHSLIALASIAVAMSAGAYAASAADPVRGGLEAAAVRPIGQAPSASLARRKGKGMTAAQVQRQAAKRRNIARNRRNLRARRG